MPSLKAGVPLAWNTWTRSLPVSATAISKPLGDHDAAPGSLNSPSAEPRMPNLPMKEPSARNSCTRSLPVSATANAPSGGATGSGVGATATPCGRPGPRFRVSTWSNIPVLFMA